MNNRKPIVFIITISICLFVIFTVYSFQKELNRSQLPVLGQIQNFELIDSNGNAFTLSNLRGKIWIADFFFTACSGICPVISKNMASLNRSFEMLDDVALVSISVNPEMDTPQVLKEYSSQYNANTQKWHFLTGKRTMIKELAVNSFKLGSIEDPIFHSSYFSLVDRNGYVRGYYDGTQKEGINKLFVDASHLIEEK